jgi:enterochelin esterase-like enzyme
VRVRRRRPALAALVGALLAAAALLAGFAFRATAAPWPPVVNAGFSSKAIRGELGLQVYLPPDYAQSRLRYPVVYFLHGLPAAKDAYQSTDFLREAMAQTGRQAIVVALQGARDGESDAEYLDGGPGDNWATALAVEAPRYVDRHFRTIADRRGRAIVGLSAGGYGAVLLGFHHLGSFAAIESWSGYFHPTDVTGTTGLDLGSPEKNAQASAHSFVASLRRRFADKSTWLGFYVGSADTRFRAENEQLDEELTSAGVPHLFRVYSGGHEQPLWTRHAPQWLALALRHLAPPR